MLARVLTVLALALWAAAPAQALPGGRKAVLGGGGVPLVSLNFATGTYKKGSTSYTLGTLPGWTYSRSGAADAQFANGTLQNFAANTARVTDQGLLVENASTNMLVQSQSFGVPWGINGGTQVAGVVAPDGTSTATTFTASAANAQHNQYVNGGTAITASATYTVSAYVNAGTNRYIQVGFNAAAPTAAYWVTIDTQNWTLTETLASGAGTYTSSTLTTLANGWHRVSVTGVLSTNTTGFVNISTSNVATPGLLVPTWTSASQTMIYWGAQLEQTTSPSSYIPTSGAAVTRGADVASITYSPNGSKATASFVGGPAGVAPASPINLGASSGGAWVGKYLKSLVVKR